VGIIEPEPAYHGACWPIWWANCVYHPARIVGLRDFGGCQGSIQQLLNIIG